MIVPDTREEYIYYERGKKEKNEYWEGNLNAENARYKDGFDHAVNTVLNLFNNLDNYYNEFIKCGLKSDKFFNEENEYINGINVYTTDKEMPDITLLDSKQFDKLSMEEQFFGIMKYAINRWAEAERDSMIVSFIDSQKED